LGPLSTAVTNRPIDHFKEDEICGAYSTHFQEEEKYKPKVG
jgi:hypothetical protein